MNAPLRAEVVLRLQQDAQAELQLATEGVLRYVWHSRWGSMLVEVRNGCSFVNGAQVEPFEKYPAGDANK